MIDIKENIQLAPYTTFNIGGEAKYFVDVHDETELREALAFAIQEKSKFILLAGGSNVLFDDEGFDGLVIHMVSAGGVKVYGNKVIVDAGVSLEDAIRQAAEKGLSGWEAMCGIPGSIGGAVRGNAGAFGTEIKDVVSKVRALNIQTGEVRDFTVKECQFSYRASYFKVHPEWVVLTAVVALKEVDDLDIVLACDIIIAEREKRHLQDVQCAGSFFKNPMCTDFPKVIKQFETEKGVKSNGGKVPAGWLIEKCGLKGTTVGGALCSEQHPNYLVNTGAATTKDVLKLKDLIKQSVKEKFKIELEEEVTIII